MPLPKTDIPDIEIGPDGVVYEGPPGGLEALLSSRAIISEPVNCAHGDESVDVIFRELSNDQKQAVMTFALQHVEDKRRIQEEDGKGDWRDCDADRDVLIGEERELRMLQAAMLDPKTKGPACSLGWLRKRLGTQLMKKIGDRYETFEHSIDPERVDEEMIKIVIEDVKKKHPNKLALDAVRINFAVQIAAIFGCPAIELSDRQVQWFGIWRSEAISQAEKEGLDVGPKATSEALLEELIKTVVECTKALADFIATKPSF